MQQEKAESRRLTRMNRQDFFDRGERQGEITAPQKSRALCRDKTQTAPGEKIRHYGISWVGRVDKRARKTHSYVEGALKGNMIKSYATPSIVFPLSPRGFVSLTKSTVLKECWGFQGKQRGGCRCRQLRKGSSHRQRSRVRLRKTMQV